MDGVDWGTWYQFHDWRPRLAGWTMFFQQVRWLESYPVLVAVGLLLLAGLISRRFLRQTWGFLLMVLVALVLGAIGNWLVPREHPPDWDGRFGQGNSFPSMEALFSLVLYGGGTWLGTQGMRCSWSRWTLRAGGIFLILVLGTSQLYCGDHYLSDVLAGWTAGLTAVLAGMGLEEALAAVPAEPPV